LGSIYAGCTCNTTRGPGGCGAVTVAAALCPGASFASRLPSLLVVIAMAPPTLAVVAGLLILGRLRRGARLNELTLVCALGTRAELDIRFAIDAITAPRSKSLNAGDLRISSVPGHGTEVEDKL
jgi:hypothetical protein